MLLSNFILRFRSMVLFVLLLAVCHSAFAFNVKEAHDSTPMEGYKMLSRYLSAATRDFITKQKMSIMFGIKVVVDQSGKAVQVDFSDNLPSELKGSIQQVSNVKINWREFIDNPQKSKYTIIVPVIITIEDELGNVKINSAANAVFNWFSFGGKSIFSGKVLDKERITEPIALKNFDAEVIDRKVNQDDIPKK